MTLLCWQNVALLADSRSRLDDAARWHKLVCIGYLSIMSEKNSSYTTTQGLGALCGRFGIATLYAFGSRSREALEWAHGRLQNMSGASQDPSCAADVDVGVWPASGQIWTLDDKVKMAIALEDLMNCGRVDLVVLPEADPFVAAEIVRGERLYTRDEYAADEYDLYVLRRAGDLMPLERERLSLLLRSGT